jgi:hypothetical protein
MSKKANIKYLWTDEVYLYPARLCSKLYEWTWRIEEGDQRGWMRVNQNFSQKLVLYSEIEPDAPLVELGQDHTAIAQLSAIGTGSGTTTETQNGTSKTTSNIDDKIWLKEQFISSQLFHRTFGGHVQKITVRERFKPQILKLLVR